MKEDFQLMLKFWRESLFSNTISHTTDIHDYFTVGNALKWFEIGSGVHIIWASTFEATWSYQKHQRESDAISRVLHPEAIDSSRLDKPW